MKNFLTEDQKDTIIRMSVCGLSSRQIAFCVLGDKSKKSTINDFLNREIIK